MIDTSTALVLILIGFLLVWIAKQTELGFGDVSKAGIVLSPLVIYLLTTGKISEFEGLGWKAKFRDVTTENVVKTARTSDLMVSSPEANKPDFFQEAFWGFCRPYYVLTDKTAKSASGDIDQKAATNIAIAIRSSIVCGRFVALIVVNDDQKPVGFFLPDHFLEILRIPLVRYGTTTIDSEEVYKQIVASELGVVLAHPIIRAQSDEAEHVIIGSDANIQTAYGAMIEAGVNVALITDRLGRFDGIITRSVIEARVVATLLAAGK